MANSSFDRLKELDLSRDEVNRLGEALKKEEFRKLLVDYVEEIQDPANRQKYEDEVKQIERERGQDVTFLHPTPGYVIKTSIDGNQKCFINICSNINIIKASSSPNTKDGAKGLQWSLPHSLSPPHEDIDNKGVRCQIFDVLFHPDTLHLTTKNQEFRSMVNNVALTAIEKNFNVVLDKKNPKFPKITFKGMKRASLLRKPTKDKPQKQTAEQQEIYDRIYAEIDSKRNLKIPSNKKTETKTKISEEDNSVYTKPRYIIKHRSSIDMANFTEHKNAKINAAIPEELIVEIDLPLIKSSTDIDLDVSEKTVQLVSEKPAKYKLDLTLPYRVNEISGSAKFDRDLKKLIISLPVKRQCFYEDHNECLNETHNEVETCIEENDVNVPNSPESSDDENDLESFSSLHFNDMYSVPEFTCNASNNVVAFTFLIKNVDESSFNKVAYSKTSSVSLKFTSISSTYYTTCYSFYVKFPQHEIIEEGVNIGTKDNNVILQIPLKASEKPLVSYLYGGNEDDLCEKFFEGPAVITEVLEVAEKNLNQENKQEMDTDNKLRSSSAINILANKSATFGRSLSETSFDNYLSFSHENYGMGNIQCVPDEGEAEESTSSLKKSARFLPTK